MLSRPRRNRKSETIRSLLTETQLHRNNLIYPLFIVDGANKAIPIDAMPGISRISIDKMLLEIEACLKLGINSFVLFPVVEENLKDQKASYGYDSKNFYLSAIREAKSKFPEACIMTDVAMDPYSSDGHDGLVHNKVIQNDETLPILAKMALLQAEAGADIIGPSDMMDGRVAYLREALDKNAFSEVSIMSYTAKYASAFYGPFRDALDSAPKHGDKKTYQMDFANRKEAVREALLDEQEGADFLMVKPALSYLDVIKEIKAVSHLPIAAYNVSGEYSMIKAASEKGWLDEESLMIETLTSIKRAGADVILTYFAKQFASLKS